MAQVATVAKRRAVLAETVVARARQTAAPAVTEELQMEAQPMVVMLAQELLDLAEMHLAAMPVLVDLEDLALEATQVTAEILTVEMEATVQVPAKDQIAALKHNLALYKKENQAEIKLRQDVMGQITCPSLFYFLYSIYSSVKNINLSISLSILRFNITNG